MLQATDGSQEGSLDETASSLAGLKLNDSVTVSAFTHSSTHKALLKSSSRISQTQCTAIAMPI